MVDILIKIYVMNNFPADFADFPADFGDFGMVVSCKVTIPKSAEENLREIISSFG
jgi:hypothetical protein